jgi:hypothetical protein
MTKSLVRLSRVGLIENFPVRPSTLYKWHHIRKYPGLFVKLGGAVFVDLDVLGQILEAGRQK